MSNYLDSVFEEKGCRAVIGQIGQKKFDWLAKRVQSLDKKVDTGRIAMEAMDRLDPFFPVFDFESAVDYLYEYAVIGNDQKLLEWVKEEKEKIRGN